MRLSREERDAPEIPTCSMADIAFLLIVFFMLTSVFRVETGFKGIKLPAAVETKKLPKKDIAHLWISSEGLISIDDNVMSKEYIPSIVGRKIEVNPNLIVSIKMDKDGIYGDLSDVFEGLKDAAAYKVSLATEKKRGR